MTRDADPPRGRGRRRPDSAPCPCCASAVAGSPAFVHPAVPVLLNVLAPTEEAARRAPARRLELVDCPTCGAVFNRAFDGVPYGPDYFVDPTRSARYRQHLDDVSDRLAARMERSPTFSVVDVGAGQGSFLAHLAGRLGTRVARAHGFDPAFRAGQAQLPDNVGVTAARLDAAGAAALDFPVDVVVTRHVLEHVAAPVPFLASLRESLAAPFLLLVETPNVAHSLEHGLLHDFCYEHCTMLGETALAEVLGRAGYDHVQVGRAFGGEYLLAFAAAPGARPAAPRPTPPDAGVPRAVPTRLADVARRFVPEHRDRLRHARARGPIALWGAAGKGALFVHLVDPDRELVSTVVDIHPNKHGMFLPGTGHRIVSPEEARRRTVRTVVVANATYVDEVAALCDAMELRADIECVGNRPFTRTARGRP
ncbi:MAG: methyltransferase domain-containing protein [Deltaproteobacteria bacterium]|nr:methyltransferase domain-containing protein [Deltaproteobacteria bacterium]